jgi:hypothetical protein
MSTKENMIFWINKSIDRDENFGNEILNMREGWRDRINLKLKKMTKKELIKYEERTKKIVLSYCDKK